MKLVALQGEVWWLARADDIRPVKGLSIHDLLKGVQGAFNFASAPTTLPAEGQGFVFREGVLTKSDYSISIKNLELYDDGVHLKVDSSTEDADIVFGELRSLMLSLGAKPVEKPLLHYHISTIVCDFDHDLSGIISNFTSLTSLISTHLDIPAPVGLRALHLLADPENLPPRAAKINPTLFRIERRNETSPEEQRYFSLANMITDKHMDVLVSLDKTW
jgi:hypothetical protein